MKLMEKDLPLYLVFGTMFFWDLLNDMVSNSPFIVLLVALLCCLKQSKKIEFNKTFMIVLVWIAAHGFVNAVFENNTVPLLLVQIGTITISFVVYSTVLKLYSTQKIVATYIHFAYAMALIGIIQQIIAVLHLFVFTKIPLLFHFTNYYYRVLGLVKLSALFREPSFLVYFLAPAVCMILCELFAPELTEKKYAIKRMYCVVIVCAYLMTFSAVACFGLLVMGALIWWKRGASFVKLSLPILVMAGLIVIYLYIPEIQMRIDDTIQVFVNGRNMQNTNLSTFTFYSNYLVVAKAFAYTRGLGSGLGSYRVMYDKFSSAGWGELGLQLNREDANSALLRITTELGVFGLLGVLLFIIKYYPLQKNHTDAISLGCLSLIILLLLRQGNYTHGGSIMFLVLYMKVKHDLEKAETRSAIT